MSRIVCHERRWELTCRKELLEAMLYERWRLALRSRPAGGGFKPPHAALAEDRRGERWGKGVREASGRDREDDCWWSIETL